MDAGDAYVLTSDPIAYAVEFLISTSADALPGSSPQPVLVLERLTLPLGSALSSQEASSLVRTTVEEGALRLRLDGKQQLFRWKYGAERTFQHGQYRRALASGHTYEVAQRRE